MHSPNFLFLRAFPGNPHIANILIDNKTRSLVGVRRQGGEHPPPHIINYTENLVAENDTHS